MGSKWKISNFRFRESLGQATKLHASMVKTFSERATKNANVSPANGNKFGIVLKSWQILAEYEILPFVVY